MRTDYTHAIANQIRRKILIRLRAAEAEHDVIGKLNCAFRRAIQAG